MRFGHWLLGLAMMTAVPAWAAGTAPLVIDTKAGGHVALTVELAVSQDELSKGLMNRQSLPEHGGMLFDFGYERPIAMWMKNTLIPLDMVFIANDGRILGIAQRTVPMSLETIPSPGPVRAVLELPGGTTEHEHIAVGDKAHGAFLGK